jgi:hypothetical protein
MSIFSVEYGVKACFKAPLLKESDKDKIFLHTLLGKQLCSKILLNCIYPSILYMILLIGFLEKQKHYICSTDFSLTNKI